MGKKDENGILSNMRLYQPDEQSDPDLVELAALPPTLGCHVYNATTKLAELGGTDALSQASGPDDWFADLESA